MEQTGGMKLDELHVGDGGAGAVGHCHAVAGGDVRIRCVEINFTAAAGGEQGNWCGESADMVGFFVKNIGAQAAVFVGHTQFPGGDQVDGNVVFENLDVGLLGNGVQEGALDFASGYILGVQDAAFGMAAFASEVKLVAAVFAGCLAFGELHAHFDQFSDAGGAFFDDRADDVLPTEACAGGQGIPDMEREGILLAGDGGNAALGIVRIGFGAVFLGDDGHASVGGNLKRKSQSGNAAAKYEEVKWFHRTRT